ncbi:Cyanovirin-N [Scleroderma citrinum]
MHFSSISLSLVLVALSTHCAAQNWSESCTNYGLDGTELDASCRRDDGSYNPTSINLDNCIGNNNGVLVCGGDYSASCSGCSMSGTTLDCTCREDSGTEHGTSVNLDDCVTNNNGNLSC